MNKIYSEEDWVAEVEVVADNSDDEFERYELKVVKDLQPSYRFNTGEVGDIFDVSKKHGYNGLGLWTLEDV